MVEPLPGRIGVTASEARDGRRRYSDSGLLWRSRCAVRVCESEAGSAACGRPTACFGSDTAPFLQRSAVATQRTSLTRGTLLQFAQSQRELPFVNERPLYALSPVLIRLVVQRSSRTSHFTYRCRVALDHLRRVSCLPGTVAPQAHQYKGAPGAPDVPGLT